MGWTYKHRNLRDATRAQFLAETGRDEFDEKAFEDWLKKESDYPAYQFLYWDAE